MKNEIVKDIIKQHIGKANGIKSKEIERILQTSSREVRTAVQELRLEGEPICSGQEGYYYPADEAEFRHTICQLNSRQRELRNIIMAMEYKGVVNA